MQNIEVNADTGYAVLVSRRRSRCQPRYITGSQDNVPFRQPWSEIFRGLSFCLPPTHRSNEEYHPDSDPTVMTEDARTVVLKALRLLPCNAIGSEDATTVVLNFLRLLPYNALDSSE